MDYYYEARRKSGHYYAVVYHYDEQGLKETIDYQTHEYGTDQTSQDMAIDDVVEWLEDNNIEAELS